MAMIFRWNSNKASKNRRKHGIDFEEAATVFADVYSSTIPDPTHSRDEDRFVILGTSARGRLLVVVFAEREEDVIRIISARRATRHERISYEEGT